MPRDPPSDGQLGRGRDLGRVIEAPDFRRQQLGHHLYAAQASENAEPESVAER